MKKKLKILALFCFCILISSCSSAPASFIRNQPGSWVAIELAENLTKEQAWGKVSDSLKERDLEFEKIDKDAGYMRTSWHYVVTSAFMGKVEKLYANRVIVDFPSNGKTIRVKTEAQFFENEGWTEGFDSSYNQTIKTELASILGKK